MADLHIGNDCGYRLVGHIKEQFPFVPVVMMSASAAPDWQAKAMEVGAYATLQKPFDMNDLLYTVARALENDKCNQ